MAEAASRKRAYAQRNDARERSGRAPSRTPNPFGVLLLVLVLAVIISALTGLLKMPNFNNNQTTSMQSASEANLANIYDLQFLEYTHPTFGFKIRYPVGYVMVSSDSYLEALKFTAVAPNGNPGSIRVLVSEPFVKTDYQKVLSLIEQSSGESTVSGVNSSFIQLGGKQVFLINYTETIDVMDESYSVNQMFFNCPTYGVVLESAMPSSVSSENKVVFSMLESFVC